MLAAPGARARVVVLAEAAALGRVGDAAREPVGLV
jgi:hypothetical protein